MKIAEITSLITFTAIRPVCGLSNGLEVVV